MRDDLDYDDLSRYYWLIRIMLRKLDISNLRDADPIAMAYHGLRVKESELRRSGSGD